MSIRDKPRVVPRKNNMKNIIAKPSILNLLIFIRMRDNNMIMMVKILVLISHILKTVILKLNRNVMISQNMSYTL